MPSPVPYFHVGYELALGAATLCVALLMHGVGMVAVRRLHGRLARGHAEVPVAHRPVFALVILLMLLIHSSEMLLWAGVIFANAAIPDFGDAMYYVAVTYTTLGYDEGRLPAHWHAVAPVIAMTGLFAFGWTTSTLFALVTAPSAGAAPSR